MPNAKPPRISNNLNNKLFDIHIVGPRLGVAVIALPSGVITASYLEELRRKKNNKKKEPEREEE